LGLSDARLLWCQLLNGAAAPERREEHSGIAIGAPARLGERCEGVRLGHPVLSWRNLSSAGLVLATLFFAASLTPSLIPRTDLTQGALSGMSAAAGYGIGAFGNWLWQYLELPPVNGPRRRLLNRLWAGGCAVLLVVSLWRTTQWQNSVLQLMQQEPVTSIYPLRVSLVALPTFLLLIALGRCFKIVFRWVASWTRRFVPRRVANVIGVAVVAVLFWSIVNGIVFRIAIHSLDASFREADELIAPDREAPAASSKTGSPASLIAWDKLGRRGREYISSGPTAEQIRAFTGKDAMEPIRVYVGLPAGETAARRARLALDELKRVGAFSRAALVVITPTGTGWVDPAAVDTMEYLFNGNVASVAQQYSYLSSPLSLLIEPDYGADSARALFSAVYDYWTTLPKDSRPKLYLHGLSLGAMNSERSFESYELLGDPFSGALWSGPPFKSRLWRQFTERRNPGSPAWLPRFRDSSFVRFMNQGGGTIPNETPWGPMRMVYLQYASDPVTFFDYRDVYRRPAWLASPRGPDVSEQLRWYPLVSMLQLAMDAAVATTQTPMGYGHVYAPQHYIDAWLQVTGISDWSGEEIGRLKRHFAG
jgi:uncharacterized membrane protein